VHDPQFTAQLRRLEGDLRKTAREWKRFEAFGSVVIIQENTEKSGRKPRHRQVGGFGDLFSRQREVNSRTGRSISRG